MYAVVGGVTCLSVETFAGNKFCEESLVWKHYAQWTLCENIYNSSSGNMAVQHTVATVLHAAVAPILEGLSGTLAVRISCIL